MSIVSEHGGDPVGLVVGTVAATPLQFSVAISAEQYLQLDDVVVTSRQLPGHPLVQVSGVVTNVEAVHEGARFASDVFLIQQGALPAEIAEVAQVTVTRVEPEVYVPPMPGAIVNACNREAARPGTVLRRDGRPEGACRVRSRRPAGLHQLRVRRRHPRRARLDLRCVGHRDQDQLRAVPAALDPPLRRPGGEAHNTKMLVFSVKGEDLLFLDYSNHG